ncbi:MAG: M17 family peptidase N-terminal domain-containing protein, partial [Bacteroidales bacterium]
MFTHIEKTTKFSSKESAVYLICDAAKLKSYGFSAEEINYIKIQFSKNETKFFAFNRLTKWDFVQFIKKDDKEAESLETCRKAGDSLLSRINGNKISKTGVFDVEDNPSNSLAFAEGMALGNYQFIKYKKNKDEKKSFNTLETIYIVSKKITEKSVSELNILTEAVYKSRDLVNEPVAFLNA